MDFIKTIKRDLSQERNIIGLRDRVAVNARALRALIKTYETLDSQARALYRAGPALELDHQLRNTITALYHQERENTETTLMTIMQTLLPLMELKEKEAKEARAKPCISSYMRTPPTEDKSDE